MDINSQGTVSAYVNGTSPIAPATSEEIHRKFDLTIAFDHGPREPEAVRFGNGIGLVAEACKAAFWDVTVQPLPNP